MNDRFQNVYTVSVTEWFWKYCGGRIMEWVIQRTCLQHYRGTGGKFETHNQLPLNPAGLCHLYFSRDPVTFSKSSWFYDSNWNNFVYFILGQSKRVADKITEIEKPLGYKGMDRGLERWVCLFFKWQFIFKNFISSSFGCLISNTLSTIHLDV